jgi:hypothetical protein
MLPKLTAACIFSGKPSMAVPGPGINKPGTRGVVPCVSIDCLESCVGANTALSCGSCGEDLTCWTRCAGAGAASCVSRCFAGG